MSSAHTSPDGSPASSRQAVLSDMPNAGVTCGAGRRFVADHLRRWHVDEPVIDMAVLATSELVANAIRHAPPPRWLQVRADTGRIRIEVSDSSPLPPEMARRGATATGGRGLQLIDRMAERWGWTPEGDGKIVWCELSGSTSDL